MWYLVRSGENKRNGIKSGVGWMRRAISGGEGTYASIGSMLWVIGGLVGFVSPFHLSLNQSFLASVITTRSLLGLPALFFFDGRFHP